MLMFRYPLVTFLTATTFTELGNSLKEGAKLLDSSSSQGEDDVLELLGLRYLLDLVKANVKALDYCTINLSSLFLEESDYT